MTAHAYRLLNLMRGASMEEIKKAYHKQLRRYHPDHNEGDNTEVDKLQKVQEAYEAICHERQAHYAVLEVKNGVASEVLKEAYQQQMQLVHQLYTNGHHRQAASKQRELEHAYVCLGGKLDDAEEDGRNDDW